MNEIRIKGARLHNLKNIDLTIPKQKLVMITGVSGSGKSSLAFDLIFEEGKNQYLNSIGILSGLEKEERFDAIEGISPAVSVRQNTIRQQSFRSTVGSRTRLLNELALMYAADGIGSDNELSPGEFLYTTSQGMCIDCQGKGFYYDVDLKQLVQQQETTLEQVYQRWKVTSGFLRVLSKRHGGYFQTPFWKLPEEIKEDVIYGTYENGKQSYCMERLLRNAYEKGEDVSDVYRKQICPYCHGERVKDESRAVTLHGKRIGELGQMTLTSLLEFLNQIPEEELSQFSRNVRKKMIARLDKMNRFRLGHLSLYREMPTLSGGELQRLFLHLHLESKQDSLIYLFDEPMAGLHPSEKEEVMNAIKRLRDNGNSVIVVEHDFDMIRQADQVIEIGPKAGTEGGMVVFQGSVEDYINERTLISRYMAEPSVFWHRKQHRVTTVREDCLELTHCNAHYLKDVSVTVPLHCMVGVAGMSGSGKSSLIEDTLLARLANISKYGTAEGIRGAERIDGVVKVSQEPIGRNSGSTPASYIGIWDKIRTLFAAQPEAKEAEMSAGHFSFHSKGACTQCAGSGYKRIYLTSDFTVDQVCPVCHGTRYCEESLAIRYKGKNINEVLEMSVSEAEEFFQKDRGIWKPLQTLEQMGMGYLKLGQPTSSLSGGEAQRVKLAKELGHQVKTNLLYVLDEPSSGLSLYDAELLLKMLDSLVRAGNSVIIIEHNTELLRQCDYLIELGPEGGNQGGQIIAKGTVEQVRQNPESKTGRYLS